MGGRIEILVRHACDGKLYLYDMMNIKKKKRAPRLGKSHTVTNPFLFEKYFILKNYICQVIFCLQYSKYGKCGMMKKICENIKFLRKKCGYTQEELADQLGVTPQAVSRWESGAGAPDLSMIVPLAQMLHVTTDRLFGIEAEVYDEVYLEDAKGQARVICRVADNAGPIEKAEGMYKAFCYLREEAEKSPANYELLQECLNYGTFLSMYVDFNGYLGDNPKLWTEIMEYCIRKATVIIRYSTSKVLIEKAHNSLAWIYINTKEYDKAREHIEVLPSYASNVLKEPMLAQLDLFEKGFEAERAVIDDNIVKLWGVVGKELAYDLVDVAREADIEDARAFGEWVQSVAEVFKRNPVLADRWDQYDAKIERSLKNIEERAAK